MFILTFWPADSLLRMDLEWITLGYNLSSCIDMFLQGAHLHFDAFMWTLFLKIPFQLLWTWNLNIFVIVLYNKWIEIFVDLKIVKSSYVRAFLRYKILVYSSPSECSIQWFKIFKKTTTNIKIKFFIFNICISIHTDRFPSAFPYILRFH